MIKTYLIQRGRFDSSFKKGIDAYVKFDHMSSSEFEIEALVKSLEIIRQDYATKYYLIEININGILISVFSPFPKKELESYLENLAFGEYITLEYTDFDNFIFKKYNHQNTNFWWNLSENFMFWNSRSVSTEGFLKTILNIK